MQRATACTTTAVRFSTALYAFTTRRGAKVKLTGVCVATRFLCAAHNHVQALNGINIGNYSNDNNDDIEKRERRTVRAY